MFVKFVVLGGVGSCAATYTDVRLRWIKMGGQCRKPVEPLKNYPRVNLFLGA